MTASLAWRSRQPPQGIGAGSVIEGAIIDKNCHIGRDVRVLNARGVDTSEETPEAMIRALSIASGLGTTSAYTWLKVPVVEDMEQVMAASTLPALLLGGEVADDPELTFAGWQKALRLPNVMGLVAGRSLLYPADGDVAAAVDTAVSLL